jgi:dihydroorotate dehydrogenase
MGFDFYENYLRKLLFRIDAEDAHEMVKSLLKHPSLFRLMAPFLKYENPSLVTTIETGHGDLVFPNPVILAAGFDKDGELYESLQHLGFGGITVGTVTPESRDGNSKPRLVRREDDEAIINAMGLPGKGLEYFVDQMRKYPTERKCPVIVSIGGDSISDYVRCLEGVGPYSDAIEVNVSCPNTEHGKQYEEDPGLTYELITSLRELTDKPMILKISPIFGDEKLEVVDRSLVAGADIICATNTLKVEEPGISVGAGGLSGRPLLEDSIKSVSKIYNYTDGKIPIIGTGGISTAEDAYRMMLAGASLFGIYTALVYRGPGVVRDILKKIV